MEGTLNNPMKGDENGSIPRWLLGSPM